MLRRLLIAFAFSLAALTAFGQVAAPSQKPSQRAPKPPGNCAVSGRVMSAAEGTPLRSARVALVEANEAKHPTVYATTTDNDGHFEIKQVQAGRYEFFASHIGYLEQQYRAKDIDSKGVTLSLTVGQTVDEVLFRLIRAAVITGKVVDDTGEPMMGVNVSVLHRPSEDERGDEGPRGKMLQMMTTVSDGSTDDRGEYRIFNLKPGEYYVKAADTGERWGALGTTESVTDWRVKEELGSEFAPIYFPGVLQLDQAQTITLSAGEETQADFAMRKIKTVEVAGRVIGPDGAPATHIYVQLLQVGISDWAGGLGASADTHGEFSIKGVTPGSYYVLSIMHDKDKQYVNRQKIEVGETKIDSVVLIMGQGATIHGRIRTASGAALPTERIMVHLESVNEDSSTGFGYTEANKDGTFELSGVSDGSYILTTSPIGEGWFIQSVRLGNEDVLENGVQIENGAVKGSLDILVSNDGAQIEGTVTESEKGQPVAGAVVRAQWDPATDYTWMRSRTATTDQNGHYLLKDVPPHKYKVTAKMPKSTEGGAAVKSEAVTLTPAGHDHQIMDFKLTLPKSE